MEQVEARHSDPWAFGNEQAAFTELVQLGQEIGDN